MSDERPPSPPPPTPPPGPPPAGGPPPGDPPGQDAGPPPAPEPSDPAPGPQGGQQSTEQEARTWALLAHVSGFLLFVGPLLVYLLKKDSHEFVEDQSREALNFQITITIFVFAAMVLSWIPLVGCLIWLVTLGVFLADIVLIILAAVKASEGVRYRYPIALRLIT